MSLIHQSLANSQVGVGSLLDVVDLRAVFHTPQGELRAVDGVTFSLERSSTLAIAGESGSGKSVTARALMGLLSPKHTTVTGEINFEGTKLSDFGEKEWRRWRGCQIAMVYQDAMRSLNPIMTVGAQISEALRAHLDLTKAQAKARAIELLDLVRIPLASQRYSSYPHQFSGGMRQRAMIAMALSCKPKLLIADEPTTALDVTTQAQILNLVSELQAELGMSVIFITHDLCLAASYTDSVLVMYGGKIVERAPSKALLQSQRMPYTEALVGALPGDELRPHQRLAAIKGQHANPLNRPSGCAFHPRCNYADDHCTAAEPILHEGEPGHWWACWHPVNRREF